MKILCQACAAKYTIADEKVVGKVVKIKCKKCGAPIVVNGNDPSAMAAAAAPPDDDDDGGATKIVHQAPSMAEAPPPTDEWTVSVTDNDQRTMTAAQIVEGYRAGQIPGDAFCWRDGMADWLPLSNVPELMNLVGSVNGGGARAETAPYPGLQDPHPEAPTLAMSGGAPPMGSFATTQLGGAQAPMVQAIAAAQQHVAATPAPAAAARRVGGKGGVDLFGGGGGAPAAAGHLPSAVGERNENSVLFSIGALKAAEDTALRGGARPPPPKGRAVSEARVDDLFSLGPPPAAPILAPPPMMAPYVEPPPPPPPPPPPVAMQPTPYGAPYGGAAAAASMAPMSTGYPIGGASPYAAPQKKGAPVGLIVGGLLAVVLIGGGAAYALTRGGSKTDSKTSDTSEASQSTASTADTSKTAAADTSKPADNAKPQDTSTADSSSDSGKTDDTSKPAGTSKGTTAGTGKLPSGAKTSEAVAKNEPSKPDTKPDPPSQPDPPAETSKPADNGAAGTAEFDRGAAGAALSAKAGAASGCHKDGDPTGSASVSVTFAPSGHASGVSVGAPFGGTPTGNCIAGIFRSASVPPFSGSPVTVPKHVSVH